MKKSTLLLFLISIICLPVFINAETKNEKFDLTPKIKKGDSWKMVFDLGESQAAWNNNKEDLNSFPKKILGAYGLKDLRANSEWEVECLNSFKEKIILKFTFRRLELKTAMISDGERFLNYNDTDFPLDLSIDKMDQINQFMNKSFTCEIPWNTDEEIKILKNDF